MLASKCRYLIAGFKYDINSGESDVIKPSAIESEIHPSHKPSAFALGISSLQGAVVPGNGH